MFNITRKETTWGGRPLIFETGKLARQADGAVLVTYGQTTVLCTVVAEKEAREGADFFPLTVNYEEKAFANGKIPGGFFKREGRPGEKETLVCRLIDRPIRPLFADGFKNETQVICTVLSHDMQNDPDMVAMVGASAALTISGIPFMGPIAGCRVGYINEEYVVNTTLEQRSDSQLDLVVAGTQNGVLMVESEANELNEEIMLGAVTFGHKAMQPVFDVIIELAEACAKDPWNMPVLEKNTDLISKVVKLSESDLREAYSIKSKTERQNRISEIKNSVTVSLVDEDGNVPNEIPSILKDIERDIVRTQILETGDRIDGRDTREVRQIVSEVGILPRSHGSALFTRGETQALVVTTLGTGQDAQIMDVLEGEYREGFMLHYNFPPYSVGEARFLRGPGRREIGHGKLAWRAIHPLLPPNEEFPYTIRVVSEITESNGSSSMATVCGSSLALMDAGVPLARPVAGIAMGLIKEDEKYAVLSDSLGDEDHLGDMDFKVAGSEKGITSLQMDIKITSITEEIMRVALEQANEGRNHILKEMSKAIDTSRDTVSDTAPRITTISVPKDRIREIIGPGGKMIREICETTGTKIDIEDDGTIQVAAVEAEAGEAALKMINDIIAEPEVGEIYAGKVVKIMDFGAFVNFIGKRDGLVHISEIATTRIKTVADVLNEGDKVNVKVLAIDDRGKIKLSMKVVDQETGEEIAPQEEN